MIAQKHIEVSSVCGISRKGKNSEDRFREMKNRKVTDGLGKIRISSHCGELESVSQDGFAEVK